MASVSDISAKVRISGISKVNSAVHGVRSFDSFVDRVVRGRDRPRSSDLGI